ncbi:MAG: hypothetical protein GF332_04330 [Candidatus Moranbacteria bacterium]|nr:hypothetical protein [Candidatus Moranbacteria bacterium]
MFLLYISETYKGNWYLLGSVFLVAGDYIELTGDFEQLWQKLGFKASTELKTQALWSGKGKFNGLDPQTRVKAAKEISQWLGSLNNLNFFLGFRFIEGDDNLAYWKVLNGIVKKMYLRVARRAQRPKQVLVVFGKDPEPLSRTRRNMIRILRHYTFREYKNSSCHVMDCGYESEYRYSRLLQLADFVAFFIGEQMGLKREPTLFEEVDDEQLTLEIDQIVENIKKRTRLVYE